MKLANYEAVGPFRAWHRFDKRYGELLARLRGQRASGVYCIYDLQRRPLYVGESHTGRLYDTITRHFREWSIDPRDDPAGRRRGGTMYDRARVSIAYAITPDDQAQALQYTEIRRLNPRDNGTDCRSDRCASAHNLDDLPI